MAIIRDIEREGALAEAILLAREDAHQTERCQTITACLGNPCQGDPDGCGMCERLRVLPNGMVIREPRAN